MIHLGICYGHCATIAVVEDGALSFCQSEERLNRLKGSSGFPERTLEAVLARVGGPDKVTSCTLFQETVTGYLFLKHHGFAPHQVAMRFPRAMLESLRRPVEVLRAEARERAIAAARSESDPALREEAKRYYLDRLGLPESKLRMTNHHDSHVFSVLPFLPSVRERTLIFTLDGQGDGRCASVGIWSPAGLETLDVTPDLLSLGEIYSFVTSALGFKSLEHEYKVMGMAPYAKPDYYGDMLAALRKLLWIDTDGRWSGGYLCRQECWAALAEACSFERFDAIAGALQQFTEDLMLQWIEHWVRKTGIRRIGCAGGVFMNVKANQRIAASPLVEHLVVVPSCGDESTAIGAAVFGSLTVEPTTPIRPATHLYLGAANPRAEVEAVAASAGASGRFAVSRPADINRRAAELLAAGEVVARCSGAMEFGARALGNRSILAHPSRPELVGLINRAIKNRDFWMPFAPSVLEERMADYVEPLPAAPAAYMMVSFDTTPRGRRELAAALHAADGTCRPQCVMRAWNPDYHALISAFAAATGVGAVLNTSFNLHGEPIVMSPADALHTVERSGLRYLVLEDLLLEKRSEA